MLHQFRFGVMNEQMLPASAWINQVRQIEALGFATFLIRDHLVADFFGAQYAPIAAMATAAAVTTSLHVGSMVLSNDFRHPAMLAKEAATIDTLSGGRFELGIGAGWLRREYEIANLPYDTPGERIERLIEAVTVLRGLWSGQPFDHHGKHYQISGLDGMPKPSRQLPILIGGGQRRMLTLAGQYADSIGVLTTSVASGSVDDHPRERLASAVRQKLGWIREGAGTRYDSIELSLIPTFILTNNRRASTEELINTRGWEVSVEDVWSMPSLLIGSIDQINEDLQQRREEFGFSYYIFSDTQARQIAPIVARLAGK
jgi:probable F420-dependent oxidoreductase